MSTSPEDIRRVTDAVVKQFDPAKVILFGSRAYGTARPDSDVDLLVLLPFEGSPLGVMAAMLTSAYRVMQTPFAIEFHPRRPLEPGQSPDAVMRDAMERGVVLYEKAA